MIKVRASQIFTPTVEDAAAAKKELDTGKPFTEVIEKYSTCPSKKVGGDLGWMQEENVHSLMGEEITEDHKGKILGPIHSQYGYHILLITDVKMESEEAAAPVKVILPKDLQTKIESGNTNLVLLDIREKWEHDIAQIEGAQLISRENCQSILDSTSKEKEIVLIDWKGERSTSFQGFLVQQGFSNVKGLQGGIDAWSESINPRLSRYDIDEDDGYRYDDLKNEHDHDH